MVNVVGSKHDYDSWKPAHMKDHKTVAELCAIVQRTRSRILQLERKGVIAKPVMVKVGQMRLRLYSPAEVAKIQKHFNDPDRQKHNARRR